MAGYCQSQALRNILYQDSRSFGAKGSSLSADLFLGCPGRRPEGKAVAGGHELWLFYELSGNEALLMKEVWTLIAREMALFLPGTHSERV